MDVVAAGWPATTAGNRRGKRSDVATHRNAERSIEYTNIENSMTPQSLGSG